MTPPIPEAVFWLLAACLLAVSVLLVRQRGITALLRERNARLADGLRARDEELGHLVAVRLPVMEESSHPSSAPDPGLRDERLAGTGFAESLDRARDRFTDSVRRAQARADRSAKAALKTSMRAIQALANEQQVSISEMQDRHDAPDVLRDLLEIDHANAQFGRRAQAIAVLCGSWPGRQRAASGLSEIVRGATSRIRDYRRVRIYGQVDIAVESRAVESVVLAVAELLDNAARHSQPTTMVEVNLKPVHNGACIVIDDAGVGMDGQAVDRGEALLSGRQAVDVTRLEDPPQFGFAVVGVLAARYGFDVSVDTRSPYGGVRAVVFLPASLLTSQDTAVPEPPARQPAPAPGARPEAGPEARSEAGPESAPPPASVPAERTTAGGLPKRRRRAPGKPAAGARPDGTRDAAAPTALAESARPAESAQHDGAPDRSAEETAQRMSAFKRGTRSGRGDRPADNDEGNTAG